MRRSPPIRLIRRLIRDERGVSAVEFALLAPVMIILYAGLVVFCQAYMARKRVEHVAPMIADLVAQSSTLTRAEIDGVLALGPEIIKPYPRTPLTIRVSSVTRTATSTYKVQWSRSYNGMAALTASEAKTKVPADLIEVGESVVVAESAYDYTPIFTRNATLTFLPVGALHFTKTAILRPRSSDAVACSNC